MKPVDQSVRDDFDAWAGAAFGAWAISGVPRTEEGISAPGRLQLLIALRSLAMCSSQAEALSFARGQIDTLRRSAGVALASTIPGVAAAWPVWPLLGAAAAESAGATAEHQAAARLLEAMWARGKGLYDPKTLPSKSAEKYASPDACVTVQLGITLRELIASDGARAGIYDAWRVALLNDVLPAFPGRVLRGFAPGSPLFEDVVLAFLHVGQWLTRPELPWIGSYIDACHRDRRERLSADQLLFGGLLLGRLRGYALMGGSVAEPETRAPLARLGAAIAARRAGRVEDSLRWLAPNGEWLELAQPFVRPVSVRREERHTLDGRLDETGMLTTNTEIEVLSESLAVVVDQAINLALAASIPVATGA